MAGNGERANDDERYEKKATAEWQRGEGGVEANCDNKERGRRSRVHKTLSSEKKEPHNELCYYE